MDRRKTLMAALALSFATVAPALAQPAGDGLFLFVYRAGPNWLPGKPATAQPLAPHGAYMKRLFDEGRLVAGGPYVDIDGGMAVVRAKSLEEAKAMLAIDPAVTGGVMTGEAHGWDPRFVSDKPLKP